MRLNVLVLLSLLISLSFADVGPPPPSQATVHLVGNGVDGIGQITYHCTANPENQTILPCSAGTCANQPAYTGSECDYFPQGYFSYEYQGQNKSSEMFNASQFDQYYEYQLDAQTGKVTIISSQSYKPSNECAPEFILSAICIGLFISSRGKD